MFSSRCLNYLYGRVLQRGLKNHSLQHRPRDLETPSWWQTVSCTRVAVRSGAGAKSGSAVAMLDHISLLLLCCAVVLESVALRSVVMETLGLKNMVCPRVVSDPETIEAVTESPEFALPLLDSSAVITSSKLRGSGAVLMFVTGVDNVSTSVFQGSVHALWGKTDDSVYVVCDGTASQCRALYERHGLIRYGDAVKVLVD